MSTCTHTHTHNDKHKQDGPTALYFAASNGHVAIVLLLLKAKADPNLTTMVIQSTLTCITTISVTAILGLYIIEHNYIISRKSLMETEAPA